MDTQPKTVPGAYGAVQSGATIYAGVQGEYQGTNTGAAGVRGIADDDQIGVQGQCTDLVFGWAGYFNGDVNCTTGNYLSVSDKKLKKNIEIIDGKTAISKLRNASTCLAGSDSASALPAHDLTL